VVRMPLRPNISRALCLVKGVALFLHDITVYHLRQPNGSFIADHIERLRLDVRRVHADPWQIIFRELGVGRFFRLLCDGLDG
jgi:hypothetical protein